MEQKYVIAINEKRERSVILATPENLAAYILRNAPGEVTITTLSGDVLLEAYHGDVCRCFDSDHLINSIYRVILNVRAGKQSMPDVLYAGSNTQRTARSERSIGLCTDLGCGKSERGILTKFKGHRVSLNVGVYYHSKNLAVKIITLDEGEPKPEDYLTTNLARKRPRDCAYINMTRYGNEITVWLHDNHLAEPTSRKVHDGRNVYYEYHFERDALKKLDSTGYNQYAIRFTSGRHCYP